jgi:hypothetical protein
MTDCLLRCCAAIALMMETVSISETSVNLFKTTRLSILREIKTILKEYEISSSHGGVYEVYGVFWDVVPCSLKGVFPSF